MTDDPFPDVVVVHGAFRGAWAVGPTVERLRALGVRAHAWDLPGAGRRWDPRTVVTLDEAASDLSSRIGQVSAPVVVVGHSQGGLVVRAMSGREPANLVAVGFLDAAVPDPGERAIDLMADAGNPAVVPEASMLLDPPPVDPLVPPSVRGLMEDQLRPQHAALALGRVPVVSSDRVVHEFWAFCAQTPDHYPSGATRRRCDDRGTEYDLLDAPHDAPLLAPGVVADWIAGIRATFR